MNYLLSIIIPVFNEEKTIKAILEKIKDANLCSSLKKEVIVVDDYSVDKTPEIINQFREENNELKLHYFRQEKNTGKGAAIRTGIEKAKGDFILIQDADLEYDPEDYNDLMTPLLKGHADVIYGSRFVGGKPHRVLFFLHTIGNKFLTFVSNLMTGLNLTDMETCLKVFKNDVIKQVKLKENRFGFEPEITAKISRIPNIRIYEVGISYYGRTYKEGKKIGWRDGVRALYCIIKYNTIKR